jgi:hypothetical protein
MGVMVLFIAAHRFSPRGPGERVVVRRLAMKRLLALCLFGCGQVPSGPVDAGDVMRGTKCSFSTASGGGLCQVDFFCPDGGDQGVYCGGQGDGGFDCGCGRASTNPRRFVPEVSFCTDIVRNAGVRAGQANTGCGFNLPL